MKNSLIIFLFVSHFAFGQSVPNTDNFSLQDVVSVIGGTSLSQAFTNSVDAYFDPAYKGSKDRLSNFRNYTIPTSTTPTVSTTDLFDGYVVTGSLYQDYYVQFSGTITSVGSSSLTQKGFVYSYVDSTPQLGEANTTTIGIGGLTTGLYTVVNYSLTPGSTIYMRAFATNGSGTAYGDVLSMTICQRNTTSVSTEFAYRINIDGNATWFQSTLNSANQACYDWNNPAGRTITLDKINVEITGSLSTGQKAYYQSGNDCSYVRDGFYLYTATTPNKVLTIGGGNGIIQVISNCP